MFLGRLETVAHQKMLIFAIYKVSEKAQAVSFVTPPLLETTSRNGDICNDGLDFSGGVA